MARSKTTRHGNGVGVGDGWGGPARGVGIPTKAAKFEPGNKVSVGHGGPSVEKTRRSDQVKDRLFDLALNAKREETQITAGVAFLNREEGLPIARSFNLNVDPSKMTDEELMAYLKGTKDGE